MLIFANIIYKRKISVLQAVIETAECYMTDEIF